MSEKKDLHRLETHFSFGENWQNYSQSINENRIQSAVKDMSRLLPTEEIDGKKVLDIGCGSGLHSLAALLLGAREVMATDIDPKSVETAKNVLNRFGSGKKFSASIKSVFDLSPEELGRFDVVYSWGVLHHTGDMYEAIRRAAALVAPRGSLVLALYRKTKMCSFWTFEKKLYNKAPIFLRKIFSAIFSVFLLLDQMRRGQNPLRFIREYSKKRGMSFTHDVNDWLGGYPYESISPDELHSFAKSLGFSLKREFVHPSGLGLFGSGCDEFVFVRTHEMRL
jgi:SAM-dependent methyltransferase